jgi:hypothetical protein
MSQCDSQISTRARGESLLLVCSADLDEIDLLSTELDLKLIARLAVDDAGVGVACNHVAV